MVQRTSQPSPSSQPCPHALVTFHACHNMLLHVQHTPHSILPQPRSPHSPLSHHHLHHALQPLPAQCSGAGSQTAAATAPWRTAAWPSSPSLAPAEQTCSSPTCGSRACRCSAPGAGPTWAAGAARPRSTPSATRSARRRMVGGAVLSAGLTSWCCRAACTVGGCMCRCAYAAPCMCLHPGALRNSTPKQYASVVHAGGGGSEIP